MVSLIDTLVNWDSRLYSTYSSFANKCNVFGNAILYDVLVITI